MYLEGNFHFGKNCSDQKEDPYLALFSQMGSAGLLLLKEF